MDDSETLIRELKRLRLVQFQPLIAWATLLKDFLVILKGEFQDVDGEVRRGRLNEVQLVLWPSLKKGEKEVIISLTLYGSSAIMTGMLSATLSSLDEAKSVIWERLIQETKFQSYLLECMRCNQLPEDGTLKARNMTYGVEVSAETLKVLEDLKDKQTIMVKKVSRAPFFGFMGHTSTATLLDKPGTLTCLHMTVDVIGLRNPEHDQDWLLVDVYPHKAS